MKKSIFSKGLYVEGLRQLRLTAIIFLAAFILFGIANPIVHALDSISVSHEISPQICNYVSMCTLIFAIPFVVAPVFTFVLFGGFNKRSASDFYHSLPYTRICMFLSFSAAILTWLLALTAIYSFATISAYLLAPKLFIVSLAGMWDLLLTVAAQTLIVVFVLIMAISITGTPVANITCAGLIMFLPRLLITMITMTLGDLAPVLDGNFGIFGHSYNVIWGTVYSIFGYYSDPYIDNIPQDIYSVFLGLIYAALAALLFTKRKSETSGHSAPGKFTQHIIRICVGLVISGVTTCGLLMDFEIAMAIILYPLSVIVYFAYELITQKTFKTLPKTLPGIGILAGINVLIVAVCIGGAAYVHSYTPAASDVSAIYINNRTSYYANSDMSLYNYASINAASVKIDDPEAIEIATTALKNSAEASKNGQYYDNYALNFYDKETGKYEDNVQLKVTFVSNSGIKKIRNVRIAGSEYNRINSIASTNEEYKAEYTKLPEPIIRSLTVSHSSYWSRTDLTSEEQAEIYESLVSEIKNVDFAQWMDCIRGYSYSNVSFRIEYMIGDGSKSINFMIDYNTLPKTCKLIAEMFNSKNEATSKVILEILSDYDAALKKYNYFDMQMHGDNWNFTTYNILDRYKVSDEMKSDLKKLGECVSASEFDIEDCMVVSIEFSIISENYSDQWTNAVVFLPNPHGFTPESNEFEIINFDQNYAEYQYKY